MLIPGLSANEKALVHAGGASRVRNIELMGNAAAYYAPPRCSPGAPRSLEDKVLYDLMARHC